MNELGTEVEFASWLYSFDPQQEIGQRSDFDRGVIAFYLSHKLLHELMDNAYGYIVDDKDAWWDLRPTEAPELWFHLPDWAVYVQNQLQKGEGPVRAPEVMHVLEQWSNGAQ